MLKKLIAMILVLCFLVGNFPSTSYAAEETKENNTDTRYTVLLLDVSGSMRGNPLSSSKQAVIKFCESILGLEGENYISVVTYNANAYTLLSFTNDIKAIKEKINTVVADGGTNMEAALQRANQLLLNMEGIKNIVLFSDGIPASGAGSSTGPYTSNDSSYYAYGNAVYNTANAIKDKYNIYSLGFFYSLDGSNLTFAKSLMSAIQNRGYYEVTDVDDLIFTFGQIADELTSSNLKELYVNEHISYYNGRFQDEVVQVTIPSTTSSLYRNGNYILGNVVSDAFDDYINTGYQIVKMYDGIFNLDTEFLESAVNDFDMILADIITSSYYADMLDEKYTAQFTDDCSYLLGEAYDFGFNKLEKIAENLNIEKNTLKAEWSELGLALDEMKITKDPDRYAELFGKCSMVVDSYLDKEMKSDFLKSILGKNGIQGDAINATLGAFTDAAFDTVSQAIFYYSNYHAYTSASDAFKVVLIQILYYSSLNVESNYYNASLTASIKNFLKYSSYEAEDAKSFALGLVSSELESTFKKAGEKFAISFIMDLGKRIPYVGIVFEMLDGVGKITSGGLFLIDHLTNIDDISYAATLVIELYHLANCAAYAADDFGDFIEDSNDPFDTAYLFDEAVRIWRCCSLMLCDAGEQYECYRLQGDYKTLDGPPLKYMLFSPIAREIAIRDSSWRSTAITMISLERALISDIHCHNKNLSYSVSSDLVEIGSDAQIITIACPVDVYVEDNLGNQIAILKDDEQIIKNGYEPYFHVMETFADSNDYMKICYVPSSWNVKYLGTNDGNMQVIKTTIMDGQAMNHQACDKIPITTASKGDVSDITMNISFENLSQCPFIDVKSSSYYYNSVMWAVSHKVTTGEAENIFNPSGACTRAQAVTFLWRAAGRPKIDRVSGFTDISSDSWYSEAVTWAVENGITNGVGNGRFAPNDICTRAQIVTFLWRYAGTPKVAEDGRFFDVSSNSYYTIPISWAVKNGITSGIGNNMFAPNETCTRAQIVTFFYRAQDIQRNNIESYAIAFDTNGGLVQPEKKHVIVGQIYGLLPIPVKLGHTFRGWFTSIDGGEQITSDTLVKLTDNQTLYARWEKNTYMVTFEPNGGSIESKYLKVTYGDVYGNLPVPVREGYTFDGWFTELEDGELIQESTIVNLTDNKILYGHWSINEKKMNSITINAGTTSFSVGSKISVTAIANYSDGTTEDITKKANFYPYTTGIVTCENNIVYGKNVGTVLIMAEYMDFVGYIRVYVTEPTETEVTEPVDIMPGSYSHKNVSVKKGTNLKLYITIDTTDSEEEYHKYTIWMAALENGSWNVIKSYYIDGGEFTPLSLNCLMNESTTLAVSLFDSDNFTTGASIGECIIHVNVTE